VRLLGEVLRDTLATALNRVPVPLARKVDTPSFGNVFGSVGQDRLSQLSAYGSVGTLFQVVHALSEDTSRVDWHMHRVRQGRAARDSATCELCEKRGVEYLETHPALTRWNEPNEHYTGQEFVEATQQHIDLAGEGYWVMDLVSAGALSGVAEMWPVRPDRMAPVSSATDFLLGWLYRSPDGELIPLDKEQVIPLKSINPLDPYRGQGPVGTIMRDIRSAAASGDWTEMFFRNSAMPGGVLEVPTALGQTEFDRLADQWKQDHQGMSNAHRVAILENGIKWSDRSYSPKDMILTDVRKYSASQIREAYGFPEFASGILENANRASSKAAAEWYTSRMIVPRLDKIRDALNFRYLKRWGATGANVEFAYSDPTPPDVESENATRTSKAEAYAVLVNARVAPDDAAQVCGLPPMATVKPEDLLPPPAPVAPPAPPSPNEPGDDPPTDEQMSNLFERWDNAQKWVASEHIDENTCQPCRDNDGKTYRNRQEAYEDYPGGQGYRHCEGRGNCRGKPVKRGRKGEGS
jgi:HK97 family phage portal protein